jgi:hypothetical protein
MPVPTPRLGLVRRFAAALLVGATLAGPVAASAQGPLPPGYFAQVIRTWRLPVQCNTGLVVGVSQSLPPLTADLCLQGQGTLGLRASDGLFDFRLDTRLTANVPLAWSAMDPSQSAFWLDGPNGGVSPSTFQALGALPGWSAIHAPAFHQILTGTGVDAYQLNSAAVNLGVVYAVILPPAYSEPPSGFPTGAFLGPLVAVPEPMTAGLVATGLIAVGLVARRRRAA